LEEANPYFSPGFVARAGPRGAERVLAVRRAPRGEKTPLGVVHRRPQQKAGEKYGLIRIAKAASEELREMEGADIGEVGNLMPATGTRRDHSSVARQGLDRGNQRTCDPV